MVHSQQRHGGQIHSAPRKRRRQRERALANQAEAARLGISLIELESRKSQQYVQLMANIANQSARIQREYQQKSESRRRSDSYGYY